MKASEEKWGDIHLHRFFGGVGAVPLPRKSNFCLSADFFGLEGEGGGTFRR